MASDTKLLDELGTDAEKWAKTFLQTFKGANVDEGDYIAWFANAIEAGKRAGRSAPRTVREVLDHPKVGQAWGRVISALKDYEKTVAEVMCADEQ